jgi:hypothetical protein
MPQWNWDDLELDLAWLDWTPDLSGWETNELNIDFSEFETDTTDNSEEVDWDGNPVKTEWEEGWEEDKEDKSETVENLDWEGKEGASDKDTKEDDTDTTLSEIDELLKELDDSNTEWSDDLDEAQKIIDSLKDVEWTEGAVTLLKQLQTESKQDKKTIDTLKKLVWKIDKEKWDLSLKNAELELYGTNDDAQLVYLNSNMTKARAGDEKTKERIVKIIDDLRTELAGWTKEQEEADKSDDKISKFTSFNWDKINPNLKTEWWINEMTIELE